MPASSRPAPRMGAGCPAPRARAAGVAMAVMALLGLRSPARAGTNAPPLRVTVDKSKVDLANHRLEVVVSRPPAKIAIKVTAESGATISEEEQDVSGRPAGTPLVVTWGADSGEPVARIELTVTDGAGYYTGVALLPWTVYIPHEEVTFATDSSLIAQSEIPKLTASLQKISAALAAHQDLGRITLFIAGHTDRVGNDAYNLKLSQARAQAIGRWFRQHGLRVPIAFEGFGERAPAVQTADNVDEPRNRRVDYILSVEEPAMKTTGFRPTWKRIP